MIDTNDMSDKDFKVLVIIDEICKFGCKECCMAPDSDKRKRNMLDYLRRIKEVYDATI